MKRSLSLSLVVLYCPHDSDHNPVTHFILGGLSVHPENPRRSVCLLNTVKAFKDVILTECFREATQQELEQVHTSELINFVNNAWQSLFTFTNNENAEVIVDMCPPICRNVQFKPKVLHSQAGYYCIDISTPIGKNTAKIARTSAAIAIDAAKRLSSSLSQAKSSSELIYALCRPPGHHATRDRYGGYCYFNNVALAAEILSKHGRVVVLDVDYHHGNGTQDIFYERNDVYYISLHGDPEYEYPSYAGAADELGVGVGLNFNKNFPLPVDTDWSNYKPAFNEAIDIISKFNPTTILVSLGLDAADGDPICKFHLKPDNYYEMGTAIHNLGKPILVVQEGGYSENEMLGACAGQFIKALLAL